MHECTVPFAPRQRRLLQAQHALENDQSDERSAKLITLESLALVREAGELITTVA